MKAILRQVRISPKKVNLVAGIVRKMPALKALDTLKFTNKKAAKILYKVVASALANAENNFKQSGEDLSITEIVINEGPTYKRSIPCSRGRVHPILKKTSHIIVKVGIIEDEEKPAKKVTKKATKKVETKAEEKKSEPKSKPKKEEKAEEKKEAKAEASKKEEKKEEKKSDK